MDIGANLNQFVGDRKPDRRYTSFDYCFNYFQSFRADRITEIAAKKNMQLSCLHLGMFLASWGMFRGSTVALGRSAKHFEPVIELIADTPSDMWDIDAHGYTRGVCQQLIEQHRQIRESMRDPARPSRDPTTTLATKIMLGVFGNVPAYDDFFKRGRKSEGRTGAFGVRSLLQLGQFYQEHAEAIEAYRIPTLDFRTGQPTSLRYTRAKVLDMVFFIEGGGTGSKI